MKCPNCGAEMPTGSLYCEQCGDDIHIVPDFEPEIELNMEQTISEIAGDINEVPRQSDWEDEEDEPFSLEFLGISNHILLTVIVSVVCVIALIVGFRIYQYHSVEVQTEKAQECVEQTRYDDAIAYYMRALELSDNDVSLKFKLAEVYFLKNNKIEYEFLLREIVTSPDATKEQMENAYGKLIAIYRGREDYESINELLVGSNNQEVLSAYRDYVAMPPEFSIPAGFYSSMQPLKLSAYGTGKIYYTLDGSVPDESSEQYIAPIILDNGKHTISAYFVNQYGIASESVTKTYEIEIDALPKPSVATVSGEYNIPTYIEILEDAEEVYYTSDGSTPTIHSNHYNGPIHMPLGKSTYKFVRIEGGRSSAVVERTYNLVLDTAYTVEDAEKDVVDYSIESGKIYTEEGFLYNSDDKYKYQFQYTINYNDEGHYYVISEFLESADGTRTKTGNHFALDVYNGEFFKLLIEEDNNYTLVEIEE